MASDRVIEEIKQRLDLVEYIGRTVELKRAGRTYKACCPFHLEKTPSFVVFPHTNTWHCFGSCGVGGDLFSFVQKREGLSFGETLALLARDAGVEIAEESDTQRAVRAERDKLYALCEAAALQFQAWLRDLPAAQGCRDYVARRAIAPETIQRFGLGYAPDSWDALLAVLTERGYTAQDMALVGLVRERDNGGFYDALRDRLIFPIRDVRGRVIGFGGRALHAEQMPKYINSPQTPLFDKGRTLYGLDLAKDSIRNAERAVLVEGYMDVIAAHQANFTNVVASLGTALTGEQLRLLNRYSPNLVLALDADDAGQKAAERGLEAVLNLQREARQARWERARQGRERASDVEGDIRVLVMPAGYDPDDLIRESPAQWERLIGEAQPVMDYLIGKRLGGVEITDPVQKARVAAELLPFIAEIDSTLVRDHYLQRLARLLRTDERTLAQEMVALQGQRRAAPRPAPPRDSAPDGPPPPPPLDDYGYEMGEEGYGEDDFLPSPPDEAAPLVAAEEPRTLEAYLLYLFVEQPPFLAQAQALGIRPDMWEQTEHRQLYQSLCDSPPESAAHLEEFVEELEPPVARHLRRIVHFYATHPPIMREEWEEESFTRLQDFLIRFDERQARQLHYLLDDLQRTLEADPQELRDLLQQKARFDQSKLRRQRLLHERARQRKLATPNRP